jgi:hypothetical protein
VCGLHSDSGLIKNDGIEAVKNMVGMDPVIIQVAIEPHDDGAVFSG